MAKPPERFGICGGARRWLALVLASQLNGTEPTEILEQPSSLSTNSMPAMAAFTQIGVPSRFSNASFGVYHAARTLETAIEATKYHRAKFRVGFWHGTSLAPGNGNR